MTGLRRLRAALVCGLVSSSALRAQAPVATPPIEMTVPDDGSGLATLHAYANLVQMPVLVLSAGRLTVPVVKPERFSLSIDNGPRFQPTHVRPEGADVISLTIVLDFGGTAAELMPKIGEALDRNAQRLTPRDHVSLMVMQCGLSDVITDVPAEPGLLRQKISDAVKTWAKRDRAKPCEEDTHLWDALSMAALRLSDLPGRRVIIAVTDGVDRGSQHGPDELAAQMWRFAVTTFGVRPAVDASVALPNLGKSGPASPMKTSYGRVTFENSLERLSEISGGITLQADRLDVGKQFARIPELVRGRYILDFPRPSNTTAGNHTFDVKVAKSDDIVHSSGVTFPLPDPRIAADPTTLKNDPATTPQMGKTPLKPPPPQ